MAYYRHATARDGEACARLIFEWDAETPWLGPLNSFEEVAAWWSGCCANVPTSWVGEENDDVIGFCVREDDNIMGLYVSRRARGRGVGKHLLDLAKEDRAWITVWAYELNHRARKFYRREGCVEVSRDIEDGTNLVDVEHRWVRPAPA